MPRAKISPVSPRPVSLTPTHLLPADTELLTDLRAAARLKRQTDAQFLREAIARALPHLAPHIAA